MAKRAMALIFVLILSLNIWTGAAIVSDNDGSSFVTKAEFEAMKKSFSQQVTNYEDSITSKIDGAIASYLAGVRTSKDTTTTALFASTGATEISSLKMSDIAWYEDKVGWEGACLGADMYYGGASYPVFNVVNTTGKAQNVMLSKAYIYTWTGSPVAGKRGLVEELKIGSTTYYKWYGYSTDFKETINMTANVFKHNEDTGYGRYEPFCLGGFGVYKSYGTHARNELKVGDFYQGGHAQNELGTLDQDNKNVAQKGLENMTYSATHDYTVNKKYDYIFKDTKTGSNSTAYQLRLKDDTKYWCFGDPDVAPKYTQYSVWQDATLWAWSDNTWFDDTKGTIDTTTSPHTFAGACAVTTSWNTTQWKKFEYTKASTTKWKFMFNGQLITAPIISNNNSWNDIYYNDTNKYTYVDNSSGTKVDKELQYYKMTDGIPLIAVQEEDQVKWKLKFTDDTPKYVWLQYGVINGEPDETKTIKVTTNSTSVAAAKATITSSGTIKFTAEQSGLVFVKWRNVADTDGGGTLNVDGSKSITYTRESS